MRSKPNHGLDHIDVRGGGKVIAGIVVGGIALVVLLFVFGERIFSPDPGPVNLEVNLPPVDAPSR